MCWFTTSCLNPSLFIAFVYFLILIYKCHIHVFLKGYTNFIIYIMYEMFKKSFISLRCFLKYMYIFSIKFLLHFVAFSFNRLSVNIAVISLFSHLMKIEYCEFVCKAYKLKHTKREIQNLY